MKKLAILLLFAATMLLAFTSCKEYRHEKMAEIYKNADATYPTYDVTEADRVIDAYRGRFRINAPQGADVWFDDQKNNCLKMISPDKKSVVYVYAHNVFRYYETTILADSSWSINEKVLKSLDTSMFRLGERQSQKRAFFKKHFIREYDVDDSTAALVHIYVSGKAGYLLVGYHPKGDDSFVQDAADSFSPAHVTFWWWWFVIVFLLCIIPFLYENSDSNFVIFVCVLVLIGVILMSVWPYLVSWIRGYIPGCVFWNEIFTFILNNI